ncbi:hypothetical protein F511_23554 [Dorcoceras hygrometricum]|uniref:Uncharacterized protein n=1 Tax=Dorcoceras hygrometricum TaxID=472368 RepID=A0A2Z7BYC3_9LAMI|nr:hypothetical protein F511_23554 [Dorcoceras hygrometricum]
MASSLSVNALQVEFESVLAMEHTGMTRMFQTLVDTGLKGFLAASGSIYEAAVIELFANARVIAGTIEATSFLDVPKETVVEMQNRCFGSDVPFRAPSKKCEMNMEFLLLHDIVEKAQCAKAGSFDVVTSEKFDLMMAISAEFMVNWSVLSSTGRHATPSKGINQQVGADVYKEKSGCYTVSGTEGGQSNITKPLDMQVETQVEKKKKRAASKNKKGKEPTVEQKKKRAKATKVAEQPFVEVEGETSLELL